MTDLDAARARLQELLTDLDRSAAVLGQGDGADTGELTSVDQHPADFASNVVDADREEASIEVVQAQRERVQEAMARIDAGTYGQCVQCGKPIPDARLDAIPEAARDVECQAKAEAAR